MELINEPLRNSQVEAVRIFIGRDIFALIPTRKENETTVYSVVEEVVIVTKQLILKEEIHVTRKNVESPSQQRVVLRREEVVVARSAEDPQESIRVQSR